MYTNFTFTRYFFKKFDFSGQQIVSPKPRSKGYIFVTKTASLGPFGFPGYTIDEAGAIVSLHTGRLVRENRNQYGVLYVFLRDEEGKRVSRSVGVLVASIFLDEPDDPRHDTPIYKDGDKTNTHMDNLAWRTRSYAVRYHRRIARPSLVDHPVTVVDDGSIRRFPELKDAAVHYGVLEVDLYNNMMSRVPVYYAPHIKVVAPKQ